MYRINSTMWLTGVEVLGFSGCACCGGKFSYKKKLAAVWISRRMEIECCGRKYVETAGSAGLFVALLSLSIIPAFFVEPMAYYGIFIAWAAALSFVIPLFTRYKEKRLYGLYDSFVKRVFVETGWGAWIAFVIMILGQNIIWYRKFDDNSFVTVVTFSVLCVAAVLAAAFVGAVARVLSENKKLRGEN